MTAADPGSLWLVDTHTHLNDAQFQADGEAEAALARAHEVGVRQIINHGDTMASSALAVKLARQWHQTHLLPDAYLQLAVVDNKAGRFAESNKNALTAARQANEHELSNRVIDGYKLIADNPKPVEQYRAGEQKVFGFFMGQANKALKGQATPNTIKAILEQKLKG